MWNYRCVMLTSMLLLGLANVSLSQGRSLNAEAPSISIGDSSVVTSSFVAEGSSATPTWRDTAAEAPATARLLSQQFNLKHDTTALAPAPGLALVANSMPHVMTPSTEAAPAAVAPALMPAQKTMCPSLQQCRLNTDNITGNLSWDCTDPPPQPRNWAGVCPENAPFLAVGYVIGVIIIVPSMALWIAYGRYVVAFGLLFGTGILMPNMYN